MDLVEAATCQIKQRQVPMFVTPLLITCLRASPVPRRTQCSAPSWQPHRGLSAAGAEHEAL